MKIRNIRIEFDTDNAAFEDYPLFEIGRVLAQAGRKILRQMDRPPALCDHPEADDKLLDSNGNTIGVVVVKGS